jgi:hypothetical protein
MYYKIQIQEIARKIVKSIGWNLIAYLNTYTL